MPQLSPPRKRAFPYAALLCAGCLLLNLAGTAAASSLRLPLYLDTIGTMLAAALGGCLPGVAVGFLTNLLYMITDSSYAYYGAMNVLVAVLAALFASRGWFRSFGRAMLTVPVFAMAGGGLGSVLSWLLYGWNPESKSAALTEVFYGCGVSAFQAQFTADILYDCADKALAVAVTALALRRVPEKLRTAFRQGLWQQTPLSKESLADAWHTPCRKLSLRTKVLLLLAVACLSISVAATSISYFLYRSSVIDEHITTGTGIASLAASVIDADRVDEFLSLGEAAEGYEATEALLYSVRDSSPDIEYIYVYKIMEDGCHVVFDLDTEELPGEEPGTVVPFDASFEPYLPALLAGETIDPLITNDTYGWLMTAYQPVYDADGVCRCYAAADISMGDLLASGHSFLAKQVALFLGFLVLTLAMGLWLAEYNIILPVNTISLAAGAFAYNSEEARTKSLLRIRELDIRTGDEIENLYHAFVATSEDTVRYIADVQKKNETISQMQNGLILVLADMVESRDKCTGDHVRKTAAYSKIIMDQMRRDGVMTEALTDQFVSDVVNAAPLHDIGKIHVPDALLNKPGKLTDEEFHQMQEHTTAGREIIERAIRIVPETGYLDEARNLAAYHHERWDGKGYPTGLAGEDIPLSARIMAVADVFDALVSRRSYKKGFPIETALNIIREGSGTHFDPVVAEAFLRAEPEVRRVAEAFDAESYDANRNR